MRVDHRVSAVDEKSQLAESAAVADELVNVGMSRRGAGALEREVRQMAVTGALHSAGERFDPLMLLEIHRIGRAHFPREGEALVLSVHRHDLVDSHGA